MEALSGSVKRIFTEPQRPDGFVSPGELFVYDPVSNNFYPPDELAKDLGATAMRCAA